MRAALEKISAHGRVIYDFRWTVHIETRLPVRPLVLTTFLLVPARSVMQDVFHVRQRISELNIGRGPLIFQFFFGAQYVSQNR